MIHYGTQKGKILAYMQKHPNTIVEAKDFMSFLNAKPFVGYSSSARISELKKAGYVQCVGHREGLFNRVLRKDKLINLYKITQLGLETKII